MTAGQMTFMNAGFTWEGEVPYSEDVSLDHFGLCYSGVVKVLQM